MNAVLRSCVIGGIAVAVVLGIPKHGFAQG
jgi:hypothetical protein